MNSIDHDSNLRKIKRPSLDITKTLPDLRVFAGQLPFDRLYKEIYLFDKDNQHLKQLVRDNSSIDNKQQGNGLGACCVNKCKEKTSIGLCSKHRRQLGNELTSFTFDQYFGPAGQKIRNGDTACSSVNFAAFRLLLSDKMLAENSKQYVQSDPNWFCHTYAFLAWQQEVVYELLCVISCNTQKNVLFDFLFLIHAYLKHIRQLLIIVHSCVNWELIYIFYPWFEFALGTDVCKLIFCEKKAIAKKQRKSYGYTNDDTDDIFGYAMYNYTGYDDYLNDSYSDKQNSNKIESPAMIALQTCIDTHNAFGVTAEKFIEANLCVSSIIQSFAGMYYYTGDDSRDGDKMNLMISIESGLNQVIGNIKLQNTMINMQKRQFVDRDILTLKDYNQSFYIFKEKVNDINNKINVVKYGLIDLQFSKQELKEMFNISKNTAKKKFSNLEESDATYVLGSGDNGFKEFKQYSIPNHKNSDIYYDYFSHNDLILILESSDYIGKIFDITPAIINLICQYISSENIWSNNIKSKNISIVNSFDNEISYAMMERTWHGNGKDTILFNDWIHVPQLNNNKNNNKYGYKKRFNIHDKINNNNSNNTNDNSKQFVHQYIFKCIPACPVANKGSNYNLNHKVTAHFCIGFVTQPFIDTRLNDIIKGDIIAMESVGTHLRMDGNSCAFKPGMGRRRLTGAWPDAFWNDFSTTSGFENQHRATFFMFELDFKRGVCSVISEKIEHEFYQCKLPIDLMQADKFRLGVSLHLSNNANFGLGVVRC